MKYIFPCLLTDLLFEIVLLPFKCPPPLLEPRPESKTVPRVGGTDSFTLARNLYRLKACTHDLNSTLSLLSAPSPSAPP